MSLRDRLGQVIWRLRHPQTTVRGRLTALYGSLFLASGAVLLAITYLLVEHTFPVESQKSTGTGGNQIAGAIPNARPPNPADPTTLANQLRGQDLHHLLVDSTIALAIMVVISIALGWLVAGRVLRPLRTITATTRSISEDNLHHRLALDGPADELKDLSDTIDELLARLQAAFDAQRRFAANASHELRTPITVERALLEMVLSDPDATIDTYRTVCQDLLETGQQQEQLIEALLTLARSQRGLDHRQPLDLAAITNHVVHTRQSIADDREVSLEVSVHPAPIAGEAQLVERLVSNLLDNALRYNHPGGTITIAVEPCSTEVLLRVTNTGPVIPPEHIDRLLQPFQRLTGDRAGQHDGLGLGLSIVAAISTAHGARLQIQPAEPGGGLSVEVTFPVSTGENHTAHDHSAHHPQPAAHNTVAHTHAQLDERDSPTVDRPGSLAILEERGHGDQTYHPAAVSSPASRSRSSAGFE